MVKYYGKLVCAYAMHGSYGKGKKVVIQASFFRGELAVPFSVELCFFCVCQAWHVIYFTAQARHTQTNQSYITKLSNGKSLL